MAAGARTAILWVWVRVERMVSLGSCSGPRTMVPEWKKPRLECQERGLLPVQDYCARVNTCQGKVTIHSVPSAQVYNGGNVKGKGAHYVPSQTEAPFTRHDRLTHGIPACNGRHRGHV